MFHFNPRSRSSRPASATGRVLSFAVLVSLGACSDVDEDPTSSERQIVFEASSRKAPVWYDEAQAVRDPKDDADWPGEALAALAEPAFQSFLEALIAGEAVESFLSADFEGASELRPADLETVFVGVGKSRIEVRRGVPDKTRYGADELALLARKLLAPFGPFGDEVAGSEREHAHAVSKIVAARIVDDRLLETDVVLHISGDGVRGEVQQNLRVGLAWEVLGANEDVRLKRIEVQSFEEVTAPSPLFAELTDAVFGGIPRYREDFLRGIADYRHHVDILMGQHVVGMQGLAVGDVNGDGLDDVYVLQPGGLMNRLLLHRPDGTVEDISKSSGLGIRNGGRSALFFDMDGDGDQDLALTVANRVLIAVNRGDGTFSGHITLKMPTDADVYSLCAADPDGDGDLDLYSVSYTYPPSRTEIYKPPVPFHDAENGAPNVFWRQEAPGVFVDATDEVGLGANNTRFSYAALWEDFDNDGDVDLYVANDFGRNNLYINEGGKFRDVAAEAGVEDRSSGMGVTAGDYDMDGDLDLFVSNMFSSAGQRIVPHYASKGSDTAELEAQHMQFAVGSSLLRNNGDGTFDDVSQEAGVHVAGWAWGAKFLDFNGDGAPDIYSPNGYITNDDPDDL